MIHISICKNCDHFKYNGPSNETHIPYVGCIEENCPCKGYEERELLELEEGDIVLTREEKEALAKEISHHYVSYDNTIARKVIRRIID